MLLALLGSLLALATPTAQELLTSMDDNLQYDTRTSRTTMQVIDARTTRSYAIVGYGRGEQEMAMEYLQPERDKGTRMLKIGEELWIYMPRSERVQKISGHMLRQGMMGSDMSYEDMMNAADFEDFYTATVVGEETMDGRPSWKIEALAKDASVSYPRRLIWVDQEWLVPTRQELYALSGMQLKTWTMGDVRRIGERWVPMHMEVTDALRQGSKTVIQLDEVKFGVELEGEVFSRRWLERK